MILQRMQRANGIKGILMLASFVAAGAEIAGFSWILATTPVLQAP